MPYIIKLSSAFDRKKCRQKTNTSLRAARVVILIKANNRRRARSKIRVTGLSEWLELVMRKGQAERWGIHTYNLGILSGARGEK